MPITITDAQVQAVTEAMLYAAKGQSVEQKDAIRRCALSVAVHFKAIGRAEAIAEAARVADMMPLCRSTLTTTDSDVVPRAAIGSRRRNP